MKKQGKILASKGSGRINLDKQILNYAVENGIIDIATIQHNICMNERKRYIAQHKYAIWQGTKNKWYTHLPGESENSRKLVKRNTREQIEDAIVDYYKNVEEEPYIKDVFYEWINRKLEYGEILKQTYDRYETDFIKYFPKSELYGIKFRYITEDMLELFIRRTIRDEQLTSKSWGNLRTLINGVFKYGKKMGYTNISVTNFMGDLEISSKVFKRRYFSDEESVFTDTEVEKILSYIDNNSISIVNLGISLAFLTGLRAGELAALKYSDLNGNILNVDKTEIRYKNNSTYVFEVRNYTKGSEGHRKVILTDDAVKIIEIAHQLNPYSEYLFTYNGKRLKGKAFTVKLYKICDYVNIPRRSLHKVRKTYGTKLLNAGLDEKLITKQMGHTDISTTKNYYYYNNRNLNDIKNAINAAIG